MLDLHIKARRNRPYKTKTNVIYLVFVWTVSGALRNNACKQTKVSAIASLMCKSYKLCHLPAFCVEPSNFQEPVCNCAYFTYCDHYRKITTEKMSISKEVETEILKILQDMCYCTSEEKYQDVNTNLKGIANSKIMSYFDIISIF